MEHYTCEYCQNCPICKYREEYEQTIDKLSGIYDAVKDKAGDYPGFVTLNVKLSCKYFTGLNSVK